MSTTSVNSEFGKLERVIIHTPGSEMENMTPENAQRALYSDILNLSISSEEFKQMASVLKKLAKVSEVSELLTEIISSKEVMSFLTTQILEKEGIDIEPVMNDCPPLERAKLLIEGIPLPKNNISNFLSREHFLLNPLHNLFFTRDSAMAMNDKILLGKMANTVRNRETIIMNAIFNFHPQFQTEIVNLPSDTKSKNRSTIEGGDFLVARDDIFIIGTGSRTSPTAIDSVIENIITSKKEPHHFIVQELPESPESFIHLDMVFTLLGQDSCMVYSPVVFGQDKYKTVHVVTQNHQIVKIEEVSDIPAILSRLGMDLKPVFCGGKTDTWIQEREQWHSGANFFAFEPDKVIGYERNVHTLESLNNSGFEIIKAEDIIENRKTADNYKKCVITIKGSELSRGGGGARCMTMPVNRAKVKW